MHRSMAKQLARARKLHLVLDIDLTLLHATIDPRAETLPPPPAGMEVHAFDVMAMGRPLRHWCCLRPGLREFLQRAHGLYVLTIYTHGRRDYAHEVGGADGGNARTKSPMPRSIRSVLSEGAVLTGIPPS